jgi:hypothetical protein
LVSLVVVALERPQAMALPVAEESRLLGQCEAKEPAVAVAVLTHEALMFDPAAVARASGEGKVGGPVVEHPGKVATALEAVAMGVNEGVAVDEVAVALHEVRMADEMARPKSRPVLGFSRRRVARKVLLDPYLLRSCYA